MLGVSQIIRESNRLYGDEYEVTRSCRIFPTPSTPKHGSPTKLAETAHVRIRIHDVLGQLVRELDLGEQPAGDYLSRQRATYWDGRSDMGETVGSGVYFYTLEAGDYRRTRRMTVVR